MQLRVSHLCCSCMLTKSRSVLVSLVIPMSAKVQSLTLCVLRKSAMLHQLLERLRLTVLLHFVLIVAVFYQELSNS